MLSIRIFEAVDGKLVITDQCLRIPQLKAVYDSQKDPIPAFNYIDWMTAPDSPYSRLPEEEKLQMISEDAGGDFEVDDELITAAIDKLNALYVTPTKRYYEAVKKSLDITSEQLSNITQITYGKDGNAEMIDKMQMNAGKKIEAFKKLEKITEEEIKVVLRGKAQSGMY